jgi:hypothetical protein
MNQQNSTTLVKSAINIFICIAIGVSLFQELRLSSALTESTEEAAQPAPEVNTNGTKVEGLFILSTDSFRKDFKELLIEKDYNIEIKDYPFEGNEYYLNLFLQHGHMLVVFFLVSKYQAEQDPSKKSKIMILGMGLVFAWMFFIPSLKTQRLGLEYKGLQVYQSDAFLKEEILAKLATYEEDSIFDLDPLPQPAAAQPEEPIFEVPLPVPEVEIEEPNNDF